MNAIMALYDSDLKDEIFTLMELAQIKNYTQFRGLNGSSPKGRKEGTVAWPGSNEILLLVLSDTEKAEFQKIVKDYKAERSPSPGLLLFDWSLSGVI
ncbi:MAG: hypothetical protein KDD61_08365 [Bdellovibrionales bacterium]|nr:hypothetical protein [Bdellovibrionales bacterium]